MTICIFPGTFNPIHEAHLRMAEFALVHYGFEKIIFIPAYVPPHKNLRTNLATHRFNMVKLAVKHNPRFAISDIEYKSDGKSYSIITVKKILEQYKIQGKLNFIIGTDAFEKIDSWYKAEELKELVHFIVFPRGVEIHNKNSWDYEIAPLDYLNISSTELRSNSGKNLEVIKEYIRENDLYI